MENELEVVNIRLVKEPSLYSEQILDSPQAVVELMAKELSPKPEIPISTTAASCSLRMRRIVTGSGYYI